MHKSLNVNIYFLADDNCLLLQKGLNQRTVQAINLITAINCNYLIEITEIDKIDLTLKDSVSITEGVGVAIMKGLTSSSLQGNIEIYPHLPHN